ncbi:MAG: tRNA lysidine(34) synthetase TilS [Nitrospirota bacterium]|nr:tRNA lysidine(34) synthetase TilS [Nitrospirota bacterium]
MAPRIQTTSHTNSRCAPLMRRVAEAIKRQRLIERGDCIVVAVSGGPDSVALLSVLHGLAPSWNLALSVAHFNYGLRGAESDDDAAFVMRLCARFNVPYRCERLTLTDNLSKLSKGRSLQEAAREARYAALLRLCESLSANKVAVGHTRDDQAETVIMWLLRGAGTTGLSGMPALRLPFVRPLLAVGRADVLSYLVEQGLDFREDSSNATPIYLRNRVRHHLLPVLTRFNPVILEVLARQADILREDDTCLDSMAAEQFARVGRELCNNEWVLDRTGLLAMPLALQRRILRKAVQRTTGVNRGPSFGVVSLLLDRVVHGCSGSCVTVRNANVSRAYETILFQPRDVVPGARGASAAASDMSIALPVPSTISWPFTGQRLQADLVHGPQSEKTCSTLPPMHAMLDADRMTLDLCVRTWRPGDRFHPFGFGGHQKKLQDLFADLKVPRPSRERIPLIVAPEGIVWVAGYRTDHRFRVTASTRRLLRLALLDSERKEFV